MKINVKSSSPDGMEIEFETFLMTWDDLKDFVDWVAILERGKHGPLKEILEDYSVTKIMKEVKK
jgi:hypothetical protein